MVMWVSLVPKDNTLSPPESQHKELPFPKMELMPRCTTTGFTAGKRRCEAEGGLPVTMHLIAMLIPTFVREMDP